MNIIRMVSSVVIIGMLALAFFLIIGYFILPVLLVVFLFWGIKSLFMHFKEGVSQQSRIRILYPKNQKTTRSSRQEDNVIDVEYTEL